MRALLLAAAALAASPATALTNCTFDVACVETDACAPADFYLEVLNGSAQRLSTIFGDLDLVLDDGTTWVAKGQGMTMLLTRREDGTARASVHIADVGMVGYAGRCEG